MELDRHPSPTKIRYMGSSIEYLLQVADIGRCLKLAPIK